MEVIPMEDYEGFSHGLTSFDGESFHESCSLCRRIFPHKMAGEGHFMALLRKKEEEEARSDNMWSENVQPGNAQMGEDSCGKRKKDKKKRKKSARQNQPDCRNKNWWDVCRGLDKEQRQALAEFFSHVCLPIQSERIDIRGDKIYYVPEETCADRMSGRIHFLRNGLYMGDLKKKRFEPSQPFALVLSRETFDSCLNFPGEDERLQRYLRGESFQLSAEEQAGLSNGWYLILADGYPLGFGKLAGQTVKNKYPAGWRKN